MEVSSKAPDISFVIPSYQSESTIELTLRSIRGQETPLSYEIVVVHSSPGSLPAALETDYPELQLVRSSHRLWPGAARNLGAERARGRWLAFFVAAGAVASSLYYSESVGFIPCEFCWYQRIAMYPLAVILLVAAVTNDHRATRYVAPIALIGVALSVYHYQLQLFPDQASSCSSGVPCHSRYVEAFGFVSIPLMALCGFIAILALQVAMHRARGSEASN